MKKRISHVAVVLIILLSVPFVSCNKKKQIQSVGAGVSIELAQNRVENIKNVEYELFVNIPDSLNDDVAIRTSISFNVSKSQDVILDFKNSSAPSNVKVNMKSADIVFQDEHVYVPSKYIVDGKNVIEMNVVSDGRSMNRRKDFVYTLFVPDRARTLFPCFDQPDMKAVYSLSIGVPATWCTVANAKMLLESVENNRKICYFDKTSPLSTYLFSFVAGDFKIADDTRGKHHIRAYYRETDEDKIDQMPDMFDLVFKSLDWMESYTGIAYPFEKYDFIILPGFQFGGMEHVGATLYNDRRMFLEKSPSMDDVVGRAELIAHETSHMWFGDYVTMRWFNDVWTKEVFANYFASKIVSSLFPVTNNRNSFLMSFYPYAYTDDRTMGAVSIRQELPNLATAGLVYGNSVYNKAPIVMDMLVDKLGEASFQKGICRYLRSYPYSNADWNDLVSILDDETDEDLAQWSKEWVESKGRPFVNITCSSDSVCFEQMDPFGRNLIWEQSFKCGFVTKTGTFSEFEVKMNKDIQSYAALHGRVDFVIPNTDGRAYALFASDSSTMEKWLSMSVSNKLPNVSKTALIINLYECVRAGLLDASMFCETMSGAISKMSDEKLQDLCMNYVSSLCVNSLLQDSSQNNVYKICQDSFEKMIKSETSPSLKRTALKYYMRFFKDDCDLAYDLWATSGESQNSVLGENDKMELAYALMLRLPNRADSIQSATLNSLSNDDRKEAFAFISSAASPSASVRDSIFRVLLTPQGRRIEPYAVKALSLLNHAFVQKRALPYIVPSLEILPQIQVTGDIFLPSNWLKALLSGHNSEDADNMVRQYIIRHPELPELLKNKVLLTFNMKASI